MHLSTDNRLFERITGELAVRYSPHGSNGEFCTTTKNISGGGVRMTLMKKVSPGSILDLEIFRYSSEIKTRCRGKVVWIWNEPTHKNDEQHFEAGIEFIERPLLYIGRLMEYLEKQNNVFESTL